MTLPAGKIGSPQLQDSSEHENVNVEAPAELEFVEQFNAANEMDEKIDEGMNEENRFATLVNESIEMLPELLLPMSNWSIELDKLESEPDDANFNADFLDRIVLQSPIDLGAAQEQSEYSGLSLSSPQHPIPLNLRTEFCTPRAAVKPVFSKVKPAIRKPERNSPSTLFSSPVTMVQGVILSGEPSTRSSKDLRISKTFTPKATPTQDEKRLRHSMMMRANRERVNEKFDDLKNVLLSSVVSTSHRNPMSNKIQVLDCVLEQYPIMRARCAKLRADYLLGSSRDDVGIALLAGSLSLQAAAETLARLLLGVQGWKAAEVWKLSDEGFKLGRALSSVHNSTATTLRFRSFSARAHLTNASDEFVERAARLTTSTWIPDIAGCRIRFPRTKDAIVAKVSTAIYIPLSPSEDRVARAVLVLYHADDERAPHSSRIRPFNDYEVARVDDLASVIRHSE